MIERRRIGKRFGAGYRVALVFFFAVCILFLSGRDLGPSWSAMLGHGTHGTFTAERCDRGKSGCHWKGGFVSDTGRTVRPEVGLAAGGGVGHVGQRVQAVDTGDGANVYPRGGGWDWLITTVLFAASLAALIWTLTVPVRALRRRRRAPVSL